MLAPFTPGSRCPVRVVPFVFSMIYTSVVELVFVITSPEREALAATMRVAVPDTVA
jgi:hypothetical protein